MKKTLSFAAIHFTVAMIVAYLLTGDILLGSLIAMIEPMVNTVAFYFHERAWNMMSKRNQRTQTPQWKTVSFAFVHFSVAFMVSYIISGSLVVGGIMALIEPSINTCVYYFHERIWQRKTQWQCLAH
ncbi:DUF2061 domain-containing protein [Vibrio tritonius]|uniref:DUF2061 domain-containing protein n=1 Tax=Vibrio tritonius TaxID=1435069 RepID=UPI000837EA05|nr:DUF2061 domain-containing protein [Vibrio tritonius]